MATFLLIPGAWHGGWCWRKLTPHLRAAGHEVCTPSLTGLGERSHLLSPEIDLDTSSHLTMGAEDMAFTLEKVPGCYFFVGSANNEKNLNYGHHHPKFDFDEEALPRAAALMAGAVAAFLK